jgi:flagellar hook-length control protein FliK
MSGMRAIGGSQRAERDRIADGQAGGVEPPADSAGFLEILGAAASGSDPPPVLETTGAHANADRQRAGRSSPQSATDADSATAVTRDASQALPAAETLGAVAPTGEQASLAQPASRGIFTQDRMTTLAADSDQTPASGNLGSDVASSTRSEVIFGRQGTPTRPSRNVERRDGVDPVAAHTPQPPLIWGFISANAPPPANPDLGISGPTPLGGPSRNNATPAGMAATTDSGSVSLGGDFTSSSEALTTNCDINFNEQGFLTLPPGETATGGSSAATAISLAQSSADTATTLDRAGLSHVARSSDPLRNVDKGSEASARMLDQETARHAGIVAGSMSAGSNSADPASQPPSTISVVNDQVADPSSLSIGLATVPRAAEDGLSSGLGVFNPSTMMVHAPMNGTLTEFNAGMISATSHSNSRSEDAQHPAFAGVSAVDPSGTLANSSLIVNPQSEPSASVTAPAIPLTDLADKLSYHVARLVNNGGHEVILQLHPPELGDLTVRVLVSGRDVSAWFASPHAQVQQTISAGISQLHTDLGNAGYSLNGAWVGADTGGSGERERSPAARQQRRDASDPRSIDDLADLPTSSASSRVSVYV